MIQITPHYALQWNYQEGRYDIYRTDRDHARFVSARTADKNEAIHECRYLESGNFDKDFHVKEK